MKEKKQSHTWLYLHYCVLRVFVSKLLWFHRLLNWCNVLGSQSWSQQQENNSGKLNITEKNEKLCRMDLFSFLSDTFSILYFTCYRSWGAPPGCPHPSEQGAGRRGTGGTHSPRCSSISSWHLPAAPLSRNCFTTLHPGAMRGVIQRPSPLFSTQT